MSKTPSKTYTSNIFSLVGETIVAADEDTGRIVTWNDSVTLNMYLVADDGSLCASDTCTIGSGSNRVSQHEAKNEAEAWLNDDDVDSEDDGDE